MTVLKEIQREMMRKSDMDSYTTDIVNECRNYVDGQITTHIMPVREDCDKNMASIRAIQEFIKKVESKNSSHESLLMHDKWDRDKCKVSFRGFKTTDLTSRAEFMFALSAKHPQFPHFPAGHTFKGAYGSKKVSNESFLEFPNEDMAALFVETIADKSLAPAFKGAKMDFQGTSIEVTHMKSILQRTRNFYLGEAKKLILAKDPDSGPVIDWLKREITVTNFKDPAFIQQTKPIKDVTGQFFGPFGSLAFEA